MPLTPIQLITRIEYYLEHPTPETAKEALIHLDQLQHWAKKRPGGTIEQFYALMRQHVAKKTATIGK